LQHSTNIWISRQPIVNGSTNLAGAMFTSLRRAGSRFSPLGEGDVCVFEVRIFLSGSPEELQAASTDTIDYTINFTTIPPWPHP